MEIFESFGINWILLVAQIVNFLVIFYLVKRFALKPILKLLKDRENTIKEGLRQAEESQRLLEQANEKERTILKKAQSEAKILLADAKREREEMLAKSEERTRVQTETMLKEAREQINAETRDAEKRLSAHVSKLAVELLEKSATELFSDKEQSSVIETAVKKLGKRSN